MSKKQITYGSDSRQKLKNGVDQLARAVVVTLGPSGRNVFYTDSNGNPCSTKDGVTVAKQIELEDPTENMGAQAVKEVSKKTATLAGDGTTTATLLAASLLESDLNSETVNLTQVKRGLDLGTVEVIKYLRTGYSKPVSDKSQLKHVATVSGNNDPEVGELIATAMEKCGKDGIVTIEESKTGETQLESVEGMQFDRGYKSPYFVTDNASMTSVLNNPLILLCDHKLAKLKDLLPLLEGVSQQNRSLLIVAEDIEGEVLSTLVVNKMRGILNVVAVKAPEFGDRRKAVMEDLAILTGGTVVSSEKGMRLDAFDTNWLGSARKVTVSKDDTTIIDGGGSEEALITRVQEIKNQIEEAKSPYEKEVLQNRLGKLTGGVAVVHVGGISEVEMKERKDRVDDALHATKAALLEGILPGGGIALLRSSKHLEEVLKQGSLKDLTSDEKLGVNILIKAMEKPFKQILRNAGEDEEVISERCETILKEKDLWFGFNLKTSTYGNMLEEGILDPTKVTRLALENAVSVGGTMLTTECSIVTLPEEKESGNGLDTSMF